ncbi:hypothetical protein SSX86_027962 [Deinandra increscens subsp. villosa]|uniref:F-box associated beta-propeller type 3 domain-containing protein n=1 Tax=Deinandra increscens subsp. villosa TaxID=3103831 RepID=A0AAP0CC81_9ASTR
MRGKIRKTEAPFQTYFPHLSTEDSGEQSSHHSAAVVASNDDLLIEILIRLRVKPILRCKSVSKHWRWLLSNRCFTQRYDKFLKSPGLFVGEYMYEAFSFRNGYRSPVRNYNFCSDPRGIKIIQSCNGLLFCSSDGLYRGTRKYYVFNPTTKQFAIIPLVPGGLAVRQTIRFMGLAFHPTDCVHYKVVCVRALEPDGGLFQIQIYSSETRKWKISIESFSVDHKPTFKNGVYWNGAIHWAPSYRNLHMYFKLDVEQLQPLPLPEEMKSSPMLIMYFGESRGHLHLILNNHHEKHSMLDLNLNVYEMLSDHSGWFVKYHVELYKLPRAFPEIVGPLDYDLEVIDVVRGQEEGEDTFMVLITPSEMIKYNIRNSRYKVIGPLDKSDFEGYSGYHRYIEALGYF